MRKALSRLEHVCRTECSRPRIKNQLWGKCKIETKGVAVVTEELKQRISAKAHKIKRYNDRILQYQQNRLFEVNITSSLTKNLMTHREVTNRLLVIRQKVLE